RWAAQFFTRADLPCEVTDDVESALWTKAIVNAAINPLTALTGRPNGELLEHDDLRRTLGLVAEEAAAVAHACGVAVPAGIVEVVEGVCRQTAENRSSMLQDVTAGRRTEVDYISGEIARRALAQGMGAPLCTALAALVNDRGRRPRR
ncbi:MAG TPA: ketopantoate reductase C-terminal domain-containing protein, partial [Armatimonadota bacterium]|nr:ketopantoate reductase C-terminal domain-containing protein [Armatimonadota bacterium]